MSVSGRSPNLTLAMQQSAALLMEKSMPMGVGKLKDMNISRCGETGWKLRCRHVGSMRGSLCWYLRLTVCDWYAKRTVFGMKWNEPIFLSLFDLFIARIVMIAMYMKTIHAHTPHVWWQKPTQNITAPKNLLNSSLQHWDMEITFFFKRVEPLSSPPKTLGNHCAQHLQV